MLENKSTKLKLMLSLKHHVAKTRALVSPLLLLNNIETIYIFSHSSYSTVVGASAKDVVLSFKEWFGLKPRNSAVLDRIFQIFSNHDDEDSASRFAADQALSQLGIRLNTSFALQVLKHGQKTKDVLSCLKFFDWAGRQPHFHHTRETFHAIFKLLNDAKLAPLMVDFLENYKKDRYYHQVRFNDTLVMGYAIAGKPDIALQLFGKMRFQGVDLDEYAYHVLLNALVEQGCFDAVAVISKQISMRGFESDVTRTIMLKSFCKQKKIDEAVEYFLQLVSRGKCVSGYMIGTVIDALSKNRRFEQAAKLLEDFKDRDGVVKLEKAYGIWLRNLVQAGRLDGALEFLKSKNSLEGYVPDVFRFNFLVSRLLKENRLTEVYDLFAEMKDGQISPDKVTMNTALRFFCKAGMVDVAIELYKSRSEFGLSPNGLVYNYLINSLCGNGSTDEAYGVLKDSIDQGFFPGKKTLSILADALCRDGKFEQMKNLIIFALERNMMLRDVIYDKFICALCNANRVEVGYLIHWELSRMNRVASENTYIQLIHGFNKSNRADIAARLLIEMQEKDHKPTRALYRAVIRCLCNMETSAKQFLQLLKMQLSHQETNSQIYNIFIDGAGHAKRPDLARAVYELMQRSGLVPHLGSNILMLQSYLKSGRISDALNFFNHLRLKEENGIPRKLYNTLIVGLCKARKANIAWGFMREMRYNGMYPSMQCYEEFIKLLCSTEDYDMVVRVMNHLEEHVLQVTSFIGNTLLLHASKTQNLYEAWIRQRGMLINEKSKISLLGQLIGVFSGCIKVSQNIEDLQKLIEQCFPLDTNTYNILLGQLSISEIDHACDLFSRMRRKGYEPNQWTFEILKCGLYKCLRTDEAERRLEEMF